MLTKPYDEVFLHKGYLSQFAHFIRDDQHLLDWLKFEYGADEIELIENPENFGYTVRYKRNQLQYG